MYKVGDRILGKYEILEMMKPGSFGAVFRVHNYAIDRQSVVKIVRADDPTYLKELIESYAQYSCKHDKIVEIHACEIIEFQAPGAAATPAVAMELEWIPGGTWGGAIEKNYVPISVSCGYASDVLFGLQFAHTNEVIHGDVKPDNVFLTAQGAKLADFGLSKLAKLPGRNRAQDLFYRTHGAPEQHLSSDIDRRTDVFATGMTLFRSVNNITDWQGRVAAVRDSENAMKKGILKDKIGYSDEVPRKIRGIINRACHPNPDLRYASCAEFRQALDQLRFNAHWVKNGSRFTSVTKGREEQIAILTRRADYEVEYKLNGRRVNAKCASFANLKEAEAYQKRYLYDNTVE